jgi:hypothetical protein
LIGYSALFTFLVGWYGCAVSLPPSDVIFAQLACPLNNIIYLFTSGITNHQEDATTAYFVTATA